MSETERFDYEDNEKTANDSKARYFGKFNQEFNLSDTDRLDYNDDEKIKNDILISSSLGVANNPSLQISMEQSIANIKIRLIPFKTFATGKLSYILKKEVKNSMFLNENVSYPHSGNLLSNSPFYFTNQYRGDTSLKQNKILTNIVSQNNLLQNKVNIKKNEKSLKLQSLSYMASILSEEYKSEKFTFIKSDQYNLIFVRNFKLNSSQKEVVADSLSDIIYKFNLSSSENKIVINGEIYRSNSNE